MASKKTPEGYVLDAVMGYLAAKRIFSIRMNTGALKIDDRFLRFGSPGMADVLAMRRDSDQVEAGSVFSTFRSYWIECKAPRGRQSDLQKSFQHRVEAEGHTYIVAYGIRDLEDAGL